MTKKEMRPKILLNKGVGVEVTDANGTFFYFYEDFENDSAISRIYRHFNRGEKITFYSSTWAKQSQFKEYMELYSSMCKLADIAELEYAKEPENTEKEKAFDKAYKREFDYMMFLIKTLTEWTNCSFGDAKKQIITGQVHYSRF